MSESDPTPSKLRCVGLGADDDNEDNTSQAETTQSPQKALAACQSELNNIQKLADSEVQVIRDQVESRYNPARHSIYVRREEIIKKIPNFWSIAFVGHPRLEILTYDEENHNCLQFLNNLIIEEREFVGDGFKLTLDFDENPYFENSRLVKEFHLTPTDARRSTSTAINWKEDMDISRADHGVGEDANHQMVLPPGSTFFSWFCDNRDPLKDSAIRYGNLIRNELWRNPLKYYAWAAEVDDPFHDDEEDADEDDDVPDPEP